MCGHEAAADASRLRSDCAFASILYTGSTARDLDTVKDYFSDFPKDNHCTALAEKSYRDSQSAHTGREFAKVSPASPLCGKGRNKIGE